MWWMLLSLAGAGNPCEDAEKAAELTAEVQALFDADKAEHEAPTDETEKNDAKRLKALSKLEKSGLCTVEDKLNAAYVLYRSRKADDLHRGHEYAIEAMNAHLHSAAWMSAISYDRWQVSQGLQQRYGSQFTVRPDGRTCMYPVAADATDAERKQYSLPPIQDAYRRVLDANNYTGDAATAASVEARRLFCDLRAW